MSVSLLLACDPRRTADDHVSALSELGTFPQLVVSTAGCGAETVSALSATFPTAVVVAGPPCSPAEAHRRCAVRASGAIHLLVHAGRPVSRDHLLALAAGVSTQAACVGVNADVPPLDAILGGRADLSCVAIRADLWTRVPGLKEVEVGLPGVLALRAALLRQCGTIATPAVPAEVAERPSERAAGEARAALDVREQLAVLRHVHRHLPPKAAGPAVRLALTALLTRLDPWVRHRQALYNQAHTTAWTPPRPDGTPVLPGILVPDAAPDSGPPMAPGDPR